MNIIHRLTLKNMAQNRRRTLVTVLGAFICLGMRWRLAMLYFSTSV